MKISQSQMTSLAHTFGDQPTNAAIREVKEKEMEGVDFSELVQSLTTKQNQASSNGDWDTYDELAAQIAVIKTIGAQ